MHGLAHKHLDNSMMLRQGMQGSNMLHQQNNFQPPTEDPLPDRAPSSGPFILLMDSMRTAQEPRQRHENIQAIREYLQLEFSDKKHPNSTPTLSAPYFQPRLPQQQNYTDCGLFLLEYAETFMQDPEFLLNHLKAEMGYALFSDHFVDEKRVNLKRLVLAQMRGMEG